MADGRTARDRAPLFEGTEVWEAKGGYYRQYQGIYPTVYLNLNTVKKLTWQASLGALAHDASGRLRWGVAFSGRRVAVACEWAE